MQYVINMAWGNDANKTCGQFNFRNILPSSPSCQVMSWLLSIKIGTIPVNWKYPLRACTIRLIFLSMVFSFEHRRTMFSRCFFQGEIGFNLIFKISFHNAWIGYNWVLPENTGLYNRLLCNALFPFFPTAELKRLTSITSTEAAFL